MMIEAHDGTTLFVEDDGGRGEPVVFQHGLGGDAAQTREVFPTTPLLRMVTVECRSHGRSESGPVENFSFATLADDIALTIERNYSSPVIVGGISMGAAVGLRLAARRPELVKALIVARPAWVDAASPDNMAATRLAADLLLGCEPAEALVRFEQSPIARHLAIEAPDNLASLRAYFSRNTPRTFASMLGAIAGGGPGVTRAEIGKINVPTLVIGTQDDLIHPLEYAHLLAALIPAAEFREITSKSRSRDGYVSMFRDALASFCTRVANTVSLKATVPAR